jgi:catechol 2,3-dioxygenase-like lactoylglutathione lyase family enzyme
MFVANALAALGVRDLASARRWYATLLGAEPGAEIDGGILQWDFEDGGWLQLYQDEASAGAGSVTLVVRDIGICRETLAEDGYTGIEDVDLGRARVSVMKDPDGNRILFVEDWRAGQAA